MRGPEGLRYPSQPLLQVKDREAFSGSSFDPEGVIVNDTGTGDGT